jgi:gamma-glutamylcyclotransferase (GGCT)/AIG2-like uncharacterized protein YtfP
VTSIHELFVYGTLRFGDVRWKFLQPFVVDHGVPDTARGTLFDTGAGYPAAFFSVATDPVAPKDRSGGDPVIIGHRYRLIDAEAENALRELDEIESAVTGLYRRIRIVTDAGCHAWAYQYGLEPENPLLNLQPIPSGDWFEFRGSGDGT